jgi:predicted Zn finger-like uncharacterized protein
MPEIVIRCPECGLSKKIPSDKIPHRPVKVNCPRCKNSFIFNKTKEGQRSAFNQGKVSTPHHQSIQKPAPALSKRSTMSALVNNTKAPPKNKLQAIIVGLLLITIALVPIRIWISNQANSTPYPNWIAASANGLAVLFGNEFFVLDYEGNIQRSQELPDDTDACQISWHGEDIWISDWRNDRILQFHDNGMSEVALVNSGIDAHLNVAVNPIDHRLYIADSQGSKIKIYNENGEYIDEFGKKGYSDGSLLFPKDIIFNEEGQLIIGNTMRSSIDVFSINGTYISTLIKHEANPLQAFSHTSPEELKNISAKNLADILLPQHIFDFALDNQNIVTIECDLLITKCNIVSYDLDGEIQASMKHQAGKKTEGDIAIWQDKLFVCNCLKRNIDVYHAPTLSYQGAFSRKIDQIGISYEKKGALYRIFSKVLLYLMILNFIPIIWLYIRTKRN